MECLRQRSSDEGRLVKATVEPATPMQRHGSHKIVSPQLAAALAEELVRDLRRQILESSELEAAHDLVDGGLVSPSRDELVEGRRPSPASDAEPGPGGGEGATQPA